MREGHPARNSFGKTQHGTGSTLPSERDCTEHALGTVVYLQVPTERRCTEQASAHGTTDGIAARMHTGPDKT